MRIGPRYLEILNWKLKKSAPPQIIFPQKIKVTGTKKLHKHAQDTLKLLKLSQ